MGQTPSAVNQATAPKDEKSVKLPEFVVLGSRIKRTDYETPQPVVQITQDDMQQNGFTNLAEAIRSLPIDTGAVYSPDGSPANHVMGMASVNFRGLGDNTTLILINGRRAVPSGMGNNESVVDLNAIPQEAVESVEVLKDGASAIYGSDAVAGVINIKLRKNYADRTVTVGFGNTFGKDSFDRSVDFVLGTQSPRTSVTVTAGYEKRNAIAAADEAFSRSSDFRQNKNSELFEEDGPIDPATGSPTVVGVDLRSSPSFPGGWVAYGATTTLYTFPHPTADPNPATSVATSRATGVGYYDANTDQWIYPETRRGYVTLYAQHDLSESLYAFADLSYFDIRHRQQVFVQPEIDGVLPAASPFNPAGERYNPGSGQSLAVYFLPGNAPKFIREPVYKYPRAVVGMGGHVGESWSWEAAGMWNRGGYDEQFRGLVLLDRMAEALHGVSIGGQTLYANPFGPEDPRVTAYYTNPAAPVSSRYETREADASAQGDLFHLPAGPVRLATGLEYRADSTSLTHGGVFDTGDTFLGARPTYSAERKVFASYGELSVPVRKGFELQAALRLEDYQHFGPELKPKVAARLRLTNWLLLRGSYTESYRTPDLRYYPASVTFVPMAWDSKRNEPTSYNIVQRGVGDLGYNLKPEEAKTTFFGVVFEPGGRTFRGLSLEADWFRFDYNNQITHESYPDWIIYLENSVPEKVVRKPLTAADAAMGQTVGKIDHIEDDWFNAERTRYEGIDLSLAWARQFTGFGRLRLTADGSYVKRLDWSTLSYGTPFDRNLLWDQPRLRWTASAGWRNGDWSSCVFVNYAGRFKNFLGDIVGSQVLVNAQIGFKGPFKTKITLGVRNVFGSQPPRDISNSLGYASGIDMFEPRFWFTRLTRDF